MDKNCVELRAPDGRLVRVLKKDVKEYVEQKDFTFVKDETPTKSTSLAGEVKVNGDAGIGGDPEAILANPDEDIDPSEE